MLDKGTETLSLKKLGAHPLPALLLFSLAIVVGALCFATLEAFLKTYVFRGPTLSFAQYLITTVVAVALLLSICAVFGLPISAPFAY